MARRSQWENTCRPTLDRSNIFPKIQQTCRDVVPGLALGPAMMCSVDHRSSCTFDYGANVSNRRVVDM